MFDKGRYNPRGSVYEDTSIDKTVQNSLKKLNIYKTSSAINVPEKAKSNQPRPILKSSSNTICAVGASLKSNNTFNIDISKKRFIPCKLTVQRGDKVVFVVDPADDQNNKYVIWVGDIDESDLLYAKGKFMTQFEQWGTYTIKWSINYEMKGTIEVVVPRPTRKEWESTVAAVANHETSNRMKTTPGSVDSISHKSSTSIEAIKDRILNEQLRAAIRKEDNSLEMREAIANEIEPVLTNIKHKEIPKTDEENKWEEAQEKKFLEAQRNSSLGLRSKSRSNKHTPESEKEQDTKIYEDAKWFRKLDLDEECDKVCHNVYS
jgi:plastocyanin